MSAQTDLLIKYGEPTHNYLISDCLLWEVQVDFSWFPVKRFLINKDFKEKLTAAFKELQEKGLHTQIKTFDGCYNDRSVRGKSALSLHAWAAAIDLNAATNQMVNKPFDKIISKDRLGSWTPEFIQTMKDAGIFFGGDFKMRPDPMHWCLLDG